MRKLVPSKRGAKTKRLSHQQRVVAIEREVQEIVNRYHESMEKMHREFLPIPTRIKTLDEAVKYITKKLGGMASRAQSTN